MDFQEHQFQFNTEMDSQNLKRSITYAVDFNLCASQYGSSGTAECYNFIQKN